MKPGASNAANVHSGKGDDLLIGGDGNDVLSGHAGNDTITGGGGDDRLHGNAGNDSLFGGTGTDLLIGGDGSDRFVFFNDGSVDTIKDFESGSDVIDLRGAGALPGSATFDPLTHILSIDLNHDHVADMMIIVLGNSVNLGADILFSGDTVGDGT